MNGPVIEHFADKSPMAVITAILLAHVFAPEKLDDLFEEASEEQFTQDLLFSTLFDLMNKVVCTTEPTMHSACQSSEEIDVSSTAIYDKLNALEPGISAELVRYSGKQLGPIAGALGGEGPENESCQSSPVWLEGYQTKVLEGSCIDATAHRIGELRETAAAPLPGKALAAQDPEAGLITDCFPCENGHVQERRMLGRVLGRVESGELWIGDRNFATRGFLGHSGARRVLFDSRAREFAVGSGRSRGGNRSGRERDALPAACQHRVPFPAGRGFRAGRLEASIAAGAPGFRRTDPRRRDRDCGAHRDVPASDASAERVAALYRKRSATQRAFQELSDHLEAAISTLGYPKAALFGFAVGFVSYNILSVLKSALASVYGQKTVEEEVSGYYIAGEIAKARECLMIALPPERWSGAATMPRTEVVDLLRQIARNANLECYQKHPREPKKLPPQRTKSTQKPHVSTAKLLAQRKEAS